MFLIDLNEDELILIFKFCSQLDHANIAKVCKLFEVIIEEHFNEIRCRNLLMVTHLKNFPGLFERTLNHTMKHSERLRIHQNWTVGCFQQMEFLQHRENYVSFLQMDHEHLYTASLGEFNIFERRRQDGIKVEPVFTGGRANDSTITSLKKRDEMVAGSRSNGSLFVYSESDGYNVEFVRDGNQPVVDFDFHKDIFVTTTSKDTKFHRLGLELEMLSFESIETELAKGFDSVNFNPPGDVFLATSADIFYLIDPSNGAIKSNFKNKLQVFDTQWISESSFLYTSMCNPLSLIDCRMEFRKQEFACGRFTATAIDFDGRFGVLYGTPLGMLILCDLRKPTTFERVFHLDKSLWCRKIVSDETHFFISTYNSIHLFNFN